ncbi:MAG: spermidine/putrescine ABC transporter substrate-binding protein [Deltaproteobacteria bacterium]|nr:spermidine/putrescine ABC transporter substrate-binding protein [Deltaproteobacteria bacterium]
MKRTIVLSVMVISALFLAFSGCSRSKPVLHVYTWADYIKPELIQRFEQEQGCQVVIDTFDSNEVMYAKLKAGGGGYDILMPSSYMVKIMHDQGMLRSLDHALLPNIQYVDPEYLKVALDPRMDYSVPYMLTTTVIAYLESRTPDFIPSWSMFDRADLAGRMTMLNDMRETIGAALKYLGYSINTRDEEQLAAARDVVIRWKKNLAKFENEQYKTGLASGEFVVVHGYSGDIMQVQEENEDIAYAVPMEGTSISCDDLVIPADAKEVKLAHRFINFIHDPDVAAENTNFIMYLCPNSESYKKLSSDVLDDPVIFLPADIKGKCEIIDDLGEDNAKYTKVWDEIKAN